MQLDIRTIIFITALIQALYAIGLFLVSRSWIKSPALNMVAWAFVCGALGGFLMTLRGVIHPVWSIVVANIFVLGNPIFILEGVLRIRGIQSRTRLVGPIFLLLLIPILSYATFIESHLQARIIVTSLFFAIQASICVYFLVRKVDKRLIVPTYSTAFFLLFAVVIMSMRVMATLAQVDLLDFMAPRNNLSFLQLSHIVYVTGITFGFIWLNCRKLGLNLAVALHDVEDGIQSQFHFIDVIAHELKTPLATIQNSSESLLMRSGDIDPAQKRAFERIKRSLQRLDNIIAVGLQQKRFLPEQIHKKKTPLSIIELIQTAIELCKGAFPGHKVLITRSDSFAGREIIPGDYNTLLTALMNILDNAMKFSPAKEDIDVEIGQTTQMLTLEVKDNGCGIGTKNTERIFKKYVRVEHGNTVPGSGIGLFMVRHIIEAHHGTVTIKNRKSGGCRVTICLPFDYENNNLK
jgi:signal transduction histidine kinase